MGEKKEESYARIGPLLRELLDEQKDRVSEATYGVVKASDFSAGEIIAKKVKGEI